MRTLVRWVRKWWTGLIPLAFLWIWAAWSSTVPWEADLVGRAGVTLKDTLLDKLRLEAHGRDLTLFADAFSEQGRQSAVAAAETVPGVRLVRDRTQVIAEAKPYVWAAERDVAKLTISGNVPLPAVRGRLLEAAKAQAGGPEISDQMTFARGAPQRFEAAAQLLIDQLGNLKTGRLSLSDTEISLSGMARELGGREAIAAALTNLPDGFTVAHNAIEAPPYIFQANKDPVAGKLTLTGYVPDNAVHAAIVNAAKRKFFNEEIVDNLKASVGAPAGFAEGAIVALAALSRLGTGSLTISDVDIKVGGDAFYDVAAEQIRTGLAGELPQGWRAAVDITAKPPVGAVDSTVCQQLFTELLGKAKIRFEAGKASIDPDSAGLLDRMVETAMRCPGAAIQVAGHTDSDGDEQANLSLSERRAQAVVDYFIRAGVAADRLSAVGYGASQPVAPNDTDDGKAQNRRIEFVVK